ncbi:hypothetical protein C3943_04130 [Lysinibacillus sp. B2A1]|nr:hypothetical protein C3943_04130 [Lysinibacillus sp. B2A1]
MKNCYLFGASKLGVQALKIIRDEFNVLGFIDNDLEKIGKKIEGYTIYRLDEIDKNELIIITSAYKSEILTQIRQKGISNIKIFSCFLEEYDSGNSGFVESNIVKISTGDFLSLKNKELLIEDVSFITWGSGILDYLILKKIAELIECNFYLEIGAWTGESLAAVSDVSKKCYSISLPDEELKNEFKKRKKMNFSRYFSRKRSNVKHYIGDSKKFDFNLIEKADLVFIDGDHSFEAIKIDTQNIFNRFGFEETIVVWHDFVGPYNQLVAATYEAVSSVIPQEYMSNLYYFDNTMCGVYIPKKYKNIIGFNNEQSDELYSYQLNISVKKNKL